MSDFTKLAEQYIETWNETDPAARRALIGEIWAADGRYTDPLAEVTGRDQIDALIAAAQQAADRGGVLRPVRGQLRRRTGRPRLGDCRRGHARHARQSRERRPLPAR